MMSDPKAHRGAVCLGELSSPGMRAACGLDPGSRSRSKVATPAGECIIRRMESMPTSDFLADGSLRVETVMGTEAHGRVLSLIVRDRDEHEIGRMTLDDLGDFTYLRGMHSERKGLGRNLLTRLESYLESEKKICLVDNQISHANRARDTLYREPAWRKVGIKNFYAFLPKSVRDRERKGEWQGSLEDMASRCMAI